MSVTKAAIGLVVAQFVDTGKVDVRQNIAAYIKTLRGTAWDGVSVLNVLNMASGIDAFDESEGAKTDPSNIYFQFVASLGYINTEWPESTHQVVARMKRHRAPGQVYEYTSVDTFVLGWLAEEVLGMPLGRIISEQIWSKIGTEANGYLMVSSRGAPAAEGALSCQLRDLARFGMQYTNSVLNSGRSVVSRAHPEQIQKMGDMAAYSSVPGSFEAHSSRIPDPPFFNSWQICTRAAGVVKGCLSHRAAI